MVITQSSSERQTATPVILGSGLTGLAISQALSAAGIKHMLVGDRPTTMPRLGESLNAEGSLEIARQFPDYSRFFFQKRQQALFFGGHALSFDFLQSSSERAYYPLLGYPATIPFLHVDRVGFDRAVFEAAIADPHCQFVEDRVAGLDYRPSADHIDGVQLASGKTIASTYVFDATNHVRFVARKLGVPYNRIGESRRVVFAHYRAAGNEQSTPTPQGRPVSQRRDESFPWIKATSLLRLDSQNDSIEGLAWCIPLGDYVSVGISVDPAQTAYGPNLLLDWVDKAYAKRGINVRAAFPARSAPVTIGYEHYNHERCYGRNWLLAGPSCCQFWFPSAAGVATGLIAARLAPDLLKTPAQTSRLYQTYIDRLAASHAGLEWLAQDNPGSATLEDLRQRSDAMVVGNIKRLTYYLGMQGTPTELAFGDTLSRMYEGDRLRANPVRIDVSLPESQATRLFAKTAQPAEWADPLTGVPLLARPTTLGWPSTILGIVDMLSGKRDVATSSSLMEEDFRLQIDGIVLQGIQPWIAWLSFLRNSPKVASLELVATSLARGGSPWVLTCQWQGLQNGRQTASPPFTLGFAMAGERVAAIQTHRADYTFVAGDFILPQVAFAAVLGQLMAKSAA